MSAVLDYESGYGYNSDFQTDERFVWLRFETWIWAALLLIQLSMVAFLVIHGRRDKSFRQAFYLLFVAVTVVDCALVLVRPLREGVATIFGTVYDRVSIDPSYRDPKTHAIKSYMSIRTIISRIMEDAVVPVLGHAQPIFLTAIAVNRFTAFAFPLRHASMWGTRTVVVATISLTAISVILGTACPVAFAIHQAVTCSRATRKQRDELGCDQGPWAFGQVLIPIALLTITSAICCIVSFVLNVGSIAMLVALRTTGRLQRKGPELQLFAHSLWMFLLQTFLAFQDVVYMADDPNQIADVLGWTEFPWADYRHSSEWLAGVNATRTWEGGSMEFLPGCYADLPPMCDAWYRLLIGELRLREDPDEFTVRSLELCLLALSGSIFLLIISGNVRAAYFDFYFKWRCLRKWQHHSIDKVFTIRARRAPTSSATITPTMPTASSS